MSAYRQWGDKTLYLKNGKCSGEQKIMAALNNTIMNGTASLLPCHSDSNFQIEIYNVDMTKSSFLATSLHVYKNIIFTKNWVTRIYHPTDDMSPKYFPIPPLPPP